MSIEDFLNTMKKIQEKLEAFIDAENDTEEHYQELVDIIKDTKIVNDLQQLKVFFYLIVNISNNHKRSHDFYNKIDDILTKYKDIIKKYTNDEIFHIFNSNKRILLFLIKEKILIIDQTISTILNDRQNTNDHIFFSPEIQSNHKTEQEEGNDDIKYRFPLFFYNCNNKYLNFEEEEKNEEEEEENKKNNEIYDDEYDNEYDDEGNIIKKVFNRNFNIKSRENYEEKRKIGENENYICKLIQNDLIDEFIIYTQKNNYSLNSTIKLSAFETNPFLINKNTTLIEYAAFYGSIQIFLYLKNNNIEINKESFYYIIHGRNPEIINIFEESNDLDKEDYKKIIMKSIKCHHNEIVYYILNNFIQYEEIKSDIIKTSLHFYNFQFIKNEDINSSSLLYLCQYDHFFLLNLLIKKEDIDLTNITYEGLDKIREVKYEFTALNAAIEKGNVEIVKLFLSSKNNDKIINKPNIYHDNYNRINENIKKSPLYIAVEIRNAEIVKLLLEHENCDVNFINIDGGKITALILSLINKNDQITDLLLNDKRTDLNIIYEFYDHESTYNVSILFLAIDKQNINAVKKLINCENIDVNFPSGIKFITEMGYEHEIKYTPFVAAIGTKNHEIIKLLLTNSNINDPITTFVRREIILPGSRKKTLDEKRMTKCESPLLQAINTRDIEIIKLLLSFGNLDFNAKNILLEYSLFIREYNEFYKNHEYSIYKPLYEEITAFHAAVELGDIEIVRLLLEYDDFDFNLQFISSGYFFYHLQTESNEKLWLLKTTTALNTAIENQCFEIVKLLLSNKKVDVNSPLLIRKNTKKYDYLDHSYYNPYKMEFDDVNIEEKSPLLMAIKKRNIDVVKLLIKHEELDINFINKTYNFRDNKVMWEKTTALNLAVDMENAY